MALYNTLGAALFTQLGIKGGAGVGTAIFLDVDGLRGTPEIGNEANIFSIPGFNRATAGSGTGQSELAPFEFEINFKPGDVMHQALSHMAGIVQTEGAGGDVATVTESNATTTQIFAVGQNITIVLELKKSPGAADVASYTWTGTVASFKFNPDVADQTVATISISPDALPVGPSGTAIVFDTPASIGFA